MAAINFTKTTIENLPIPTKGRAYYYDDRTPHLTVSVTAAGSKSFYWYGRIDGAPERVLIGKFPAITPQVARTEAVKISGKVAQGDNPQQAKRSARGEATFGDLWLAYFNGHSKLHKRSWRDDEGFWNRYLYKWQNRKLSKVTVDDVQELHGTIGKNSPITANRLLALVSVMYSTMGRKFHCDDNPAKGIKRFRERSRDRFLRAEEMHAFFTALNKAPEDWRDFFLVCLLTAARRGNVMAMRWADLDMQRGLWRIPAEVSKNDEPMLVVLVEPVLAILRERQAKVGDSPYVFPGRSKTGHFVTPARAWSDVLADAGISDLRVHDLRRTAGAWLAAGGASLPMIGKALGHKSPAATQVYARLDVQSIRASVVAATGAIIQAGNTKPAGQGSKPEVVAEQDGQAVEQEVADNGNA